MARALTLNHEEAKALRRCIWFTITAAEQQGYDVGQTALLVIYERLNQQLSELFCRQCNEGEAQSKDQLCISCHCISKEFGE